MEHFDGRTDKQVVYSIPVESGFSPVEDVLKVFIGQNPSSEWLYRNEYGNEASVLMVLKTGSKRA
ncbi:hypothetical protein [Shewanella mangrovisoli]|uniref:hypothetical protein n=1 Tax=Shewanella mangrovisoli TaxID=2864211 RepID=UPI0035B99902